MQFEQLTRGANPRLGSNLFHALITSRTADFLQSELPLQHGEFNKTARRYKLQTHPARRILSQIYE